jgi:hypothetical protein
MAERTTVKMTDVLENNAKSAIHESPQYNDLRMMSDERLHSIVLCIDYIQQARKAKVEQRNQITQGPMQTQQQVEATQTPSGLMASASGATTSHEPLRYDLIPRSMLDTVAATYTMGAKIHGERGYQKGLVDTGFIINRINHIQEHWNKLLHPSLNRYEEQNKMEQFSPKVGRVYPQVNDEACSLDSIRANIGAMLWGLGFLTEVLEHREGKDILLGIIANGRVKNQGREQIPIPEEIAGTNKI